MRYAIVSKGLTISQLQDEVKRHGGRNIKVASISKQVFCDLDDAGLVSLKAIGCIVTRVGGVKATIMPPIVTPPAPVVSEAPVYTPAEVSQAAGMEALKGADPEGLYGREMKAAVLGSGIRETHQELAGRVIYRKNYTSAPMEDTLDHDTGVASIITAVAPLCRILNMKVLDDKGMGTEEDVAIAIDDCISLWDTHPDIAPITLNLSLGAPDDGNPYNPLRVASRAAIEKGLWVIAAAGNDGPGAGTIMTPACEKYVFACGSLTADGIISSFSARGPTKEGLIKPDVAIFGENILVASSKSDTATTAKTGTSFSTPFCSGTTMICHEGMFRQMGGLIPVDQMIDEFLAGICIKPEGVPLGASNDYGCGLPFGTLIAEALGYRIRPAVDISTMLTSLTPILGLAMLGMVIVPMAKELK